MIKILNDEGYQNHKEALETYSNMPDNITVVRPTNERLRAIEVAILEYRRQHNIFESGDPVVSRCADKETRIFTYQETIGKNILVKCKKGKGYCYPKKWFSHATDAEIEVGKRLEVNQ